MRRVARVLVVDRGLVLAVRDWQRPERIGIPGGGIERGESADDAAARELYEETGLSACELLWLVRLCDERRRQLTDVFCATCEGRIRPSHEGDVAWVSPEELLTGAYGDFHAAVFEHV